LKRYFREAEAARFHRFEFWPSIWFMARRDSKAWQDDPSWPLRVKAVAFISPTLL
jgi:hypothetical protein